MSGDIGNAKHNKNLRGNRQMEQTMEQFLFEELSMANESHTRILNLLECYIDFVIGVGLQDEFNAYLARKAQKQKAGIDKI